MHVWTDGPSPLPPGPLRYTPAESVTRSTMKPQFFILRITLCPETLIRSSLLLTGPPARAFAAAQPQVPRRAGGRRHSGPERRGLPRLGRRGQELPSPPARSSAHAGPADQTAASDAARGGVVRRRWVVQRRRDTERREVCGVATVSFSLRAHLLF